MARNQQYWSSERLKARAVVDAVRELLGRDPLYNQKNVPQEAWLSDVRDAYYETKTSQTGRRGCKL